MSQRAFRDSDKGGGEKKNGHVSLRAYRTIVGKGKDWPSFTTLLLKSAESRWGRVKPLCAAVDRTKGSSPNQDRRPSLGKMRREKRGGYFVRIHAGKREKSQAKGLEHKP